MRTINSQFLYVRIWKVLYCFNRERHKGHRKAEKEEEEKEEEEKEGKIYDQSYATGEAKQSSYEAYTYTPLSRNILSMLAKVSNSLRSTIT